MAWEWNHVRPGSNQNLFKDWVDSVAAGLTGQTPLWKQQEQIDRIRADDDKAISQHLNNQNNNQSQTQPQGNTDTVYRGGGGNYQSNRDRDITLGMIDQQIGAIDNSLNNLGATRNAAQNQINDAYNKGMDRLNQQQSRALSRYATKRSDTTRDFQHSTEDIDINSANKYRALQNLLGRAGAGRSSASANVVPYAVAQDASKSRGKVADTYSTNMRDLKTAEDETKESYNNNVQDLQEQKRNKEAALDNDIKSKESAYHSSRAELLGKRAQTAGGGWRQVQGAMAWRYRPKRRYRPRPGKLAR